MSAEKKKYPVKILENLEDFELLLKLNLAIIYLLVDWSGPERLSRQIVFNIFSRFKNMETPILILNCTGRKKYIEDWLIEQQKLLGNLKFGGWGETALISKGQIIDFIVNPAKLGNEKTEVKILEWIKAPANAM